MTLRSALAGTALAALISTGGAVAAPDAAQATVGSSTFQTYTTPSKVTSQYHVYANGIDWNRPVGVVFYLDGDYWTHDQSKIWNPQNKDLVNMAREANARNMVFVPVISPDKNSSGDGITWWEDMTSNGNWFRSFAQNFVSRAGIDRSRVWVMGYSGGAEQETFGLAASNHQNWMADGGFIMVGGGGFEANEATITSDASRSVRMDWWTGNQDVAGNTTPPAWSASAAGLTGKAAYDGAGFTSTRMHRVNGNHFAYDFPGILAASLDQAGISPVRVVNGFGAFYATQGGAGRFGTPLANERGGLVDGGVWQGFSKDGYTLYWSPASGVHSVKFSGAIGQKYRAGGYENGYGYPVSEEIEANGIAYQWFKKADGRLSLFLWSPSTGVHVVGEGTGIGNRWAADGREKGDGMPLNEETAIAGGGVYQSFRNLRTGREHTIVWTASTGAHTVKEFGGIAAEWSKSGRERGWGWPTTEEIPSADGSVRQSFSNGVTAVWTPTGFRVERG